MPSFQQRYLDLALSSQALKFGEFKLKSGRISPYFFNTGEFYSGSVIADLGDCYAEAIIEAGLDFDVLFGAAYKGIPLASAVAIALSRRGIDKPFSFNRKEAKAYGDGGDIVGHSLRQQRVLIIDDVITAGTAIQEAISLIGRERGTVAAIMIGLNRQERGEQELSAVQQLELQYGIQLLSIIDLSTIIQYLLKEGQDASLLRSVERYQELYGAC